MSIVNLPIPNNASAKEMLEAASRREFDEVIILGRFPDGELRYASTMTRERELWYLELRKQMLLGIIEGATVPTDGETG